MLWGEASGLGCMVSLQGIIILFWDFNLFFFEARVRIANLTFMGHVSNEVLG
jgi:hypothetical protein